MKKPKIKNGNADKNSMPKGHRFNAKNQPDPELKSKGWDRRREAQKFMDRVIEFQNMPYTEFKKVVEDMDAGKGGYTMGDRMALNYIFNASERERTKLLLDWMDRHVPKAPPMLDLDTPTPITKIVVEVIQPNGIKNQINETTSSDNGSSEEVQDNMS